MELQMDTFPPLEEKINFRVTVMGSVAVGKSSLQKRFAANTFRHTYCITYLAAQMNKESEVEGDLVNYELWDTAGQKKFAHSLYKYYENSDANIIVFDITAKSSFEFAIWVLSELRRNVRDIPAILVGNKSDLAQLREVSVEEANILAKKYGITYIETSAMSNTNVRKLFESIYKISRDEKIVRESLRYRMNSYLKKPFLWCV